MRNICWNFVANPIAALIFIRGKDLEAPASGQCDSLVVDVMPDARPDRIRQQLCEALHLHLGGRGVQEPSLLDDGFEIGRWLHGGNVINLPSQSFPVPRFQS